MSFFKKMTKEFDDLKATFSKSDEKKEKHGDMQPGETTQHDRQAPQYGQPPTDQSSHYGQQPYGQASSYGVAPPPGPHGPPGMEASPPPGWIKQWDANSQRWFFVEQATGRTQWELPVSSMVAHNYSQSNMYPSGAGPYGHQNTYPPTGGQYDPHLDPDKKKDKGIGTMGAAAGGLAAGAVGGALIGHAMGDDSDSDHGGTTHYASQPSYAAQPPMQQQQQAYADPYADPTLAPAAGELPDETHSGSSVASSDKEDVEEAQEDYQEALRDGDHSDIEEAREDYQEEYEETYDD